jgi:hypothetical protein
MAAETMTGVDMIAAERERQITAEGWTPDHDDGHRHFELAKAGATYALYGGFGPWEAPIPPLCWPWELEWWKPTRDRVADLAKAGALIAAEIDRLARVASREQQDTKEDR